MDGDRLVLRQGHRRKRQAVNNRVVSWISFALKVWVRICVHSWIRRSLSVFGLPGVIHASEWLPWRW